MPKPNKAADKAANPTNTEEVDLKPKFETPNEGGSYLISPEDAQKPGAKPTFVAGTDREPTSDEKSTAEKILKPKSKSTNTAG